LHQRYQRDTRQLQREYQAGNEIEASQNRWLPECAF
jgi:hypothetical protein